MTFYSPVVIVVTVFAAALLILRKLFSAGDYQRNLRERNLAAPKEILDLVEKFENNLESYKRHYNETQVRIEFVNPFFKALGWDVDNEQGFAEAYKDVIHEDAIKVGGTTRAPDYSFRIGGQRMFFLETKKPSVDIKDDIDPAFQLRRYAWSAGLQLSILTDFEEFSVYDRSDKPNKTDKPTKGRVFYFTYKDYLTRWDEIAGIFSKNAVLKGSFDKFASDKKRKKGTSEVDTAFLEEIAGWREILARNIALRNPDLSTRDLNYAVQAIVNRIVFLRICEDRGIERLMKLQDLLNGERVYPRLCEFFRQADERYNSGIFHFEKEPGRESPDTLTLNLQIDDKPLKDIIKRLYYPDSPYEFSVLPAEILGQVYEQFLGKVIRLTDGHRAVVEDKPEVKKAGGVKYTPVYIVEAIVKKTLAPTQEGKTPLAVVLITVLDPACGSGSFLIVAYQYLLDWHRDWYVQNLVPLLQNGLKPSSPEIRRILPGATNEPGKKGRKKEPELPIFQGRDGEWRLTTAERKRILLNNIYGVDIDRQAVEVTKLSLLLKVLEGENDETISKQLKLFQERALPDLGNNIKCGNSLIGWDILNDNPSLNRQEIEKINPFDWEKEFPKIMEDGGFHALIGNPPYGAELNSIEKKYLTKKYNIGTTDTAALMMLQASRLTRQKGRIGLIVPKSFTYSSTWKDTRSMLLKELTELIDVNKVWKDVKLEQVIYFQEKGQESNCYRSLERKEHEFVYLTDINKQECNDFGFYLNGIGAPELSIGRKILQIGAFLSDYTNNTRGAMLQSNVVDQGPGLRVIGGKQLQRFSIRGEKGYIKTYDDLPLNSRVKPGNILVQNIIAHIANPVDHIKLIGTVIEKGEADDLIILDTVNQLANKSNYSSDFLLGILHSRLMNWYIYRFIFAKAIRTMHFDGPVSDRIPIPEIKLEDNIFNEKYCKIVELVKQNQLLHKKLTEMQLDHERNVTQRQIVAINQKINEYVYDIYKLTAEEIKIIETQYPTSGD